jgi:DNA-binding transcriptional ArsR family regulator
MAGSPDELELLTRLASRFKALGDPTRLQLLHSLERSEHCVGDLVARVGGSQANVSKHLGVLRGAGLVKARREGMNVYYSVDDAAVLEVCRLMCGSLERQASRDLACVEQGSATFAPPARSLGRHLDE